MSDYLVTLEGDKHYIRDKFPPIECLRCGLCCAGYQPKLSSGEMETIAKNLSISTKDFIAKYTQVTHVGYLLRQSERGCVFLAWEKDGFHATCRIYPFRPEACRNWVSSLSRRECLAGLKRLKANDNIIVAKELYPSPEVVSRFARQLLPR